MLLKKMRLLRFARNDDGGTPLPDDDLPADRGAVVEVDRVDVAHPDAAMRFRHTHRRQIRTAMDVNIAAHGIDAAKPDALRLAA